MLSYPSFSLYCQELAQDFKTDLYFDPAALLLLQKATERYLFTTFRDIAWKRGNISDPLSIEEFTKWQQHFAGSITPDQPEQSSSSRPKNRRHRSYYYYHEKPSKDKWQNVIFGPDSATMTSKELIADADAHDAEDSDFEPSDNDDDMDISEEYEEDSDKEDSDGEYHTDEDEPYNTDVEISLSERLIHCQKYGWTFMETFQYFCEHDYYQMEGVIAALKSVPGFKESRDSFGRTPYHYLVRIFHFLYPSEQEEFLLDCWNDNPDLREGLDIQDFQGITPSMLLSRKHPFQKNDGEYFDEALLNASHSCNTHLMTSNGWSLFDFAVPLLQRAEDCDDIVKTYIGPNCPNPFEKHMDLLFRFINNDLDDDFDTAHIFMKNYLLGSDLAATAQYKHPAYDGYTILHMILDMNESDEGFYQKEYEDLISYLIKDCHADVNAQSTLEGTTPLHILIRNSSYETAAWLMTQHGADPHVKDFSGESAFSVATNNTNDGELIEPFISQVNKMSI